MSSQAFGTNIAPSIWGLFPLDVWKLVLPRLLFRDVTRLKRINSRFCKLIAEHYQRKKVGPLSEDICRKGLREFTKGATMRTVAMCFSAAMELYTLCAPPQWIGGTLRLISYAPTGGKKQKEIATEYMPPYLTRVLSASLDFLATDVLVCAVPYLTIFSSTSGKPIWKSADEPVSTTFCAQSQLLACLNDTKVSVYKLSAEKKSLEKLREFDACSSHRPDNHITFLSGERLLVCHRVPTGMSVSVRGINGELWPSRTGISSTDAKIFDADGEDNIYALNLGHPPALRVFDTKRPEQNLPLVQSFSFTGFESPYCPNLLRIRDDGTIFFALDDTFNISKIQTVGKEEE